MSTLKLCVAAALVAAALAGAAIRSAAASTVRSAGSARTSVRGVITSRAVFSVNSKTPSISRTSPLANSPDFWLCLTSMTISSGE